MEMLCKSVVTRMPSISLSQDVQVIDDERVANIVNDPKSTPKQIANALFF